MWYISGIDRSKNTHQENNYDAFAIDVTLTRFSHEGKKQYELFSPRLNHYKKNNETYATSPRLYLYTPEQESWLITAQYALAFQGRKTISFVENVNVSGSGTNSHKNTQLLTEKMTYIPEKNSAETAESVTIVQPGSIIHAVGMGVNFSTGKINLLSKINGAYHPNEA
ncbi:MAG: LPS export ABC transporter periplasmic protein LptC [Gammaproteobacteria bacterium]|nr:LPS export ABC transporter periplasmic protein LptC [Gammaproteobacteria bacterium]